MLLRCLKETLKQGWSFFEDEIAEDLVSTQIVLGSDSPISIC